MRMSDGVYDVLKWIQRLLLPALATLYLSLGSIWKGIVPLPYPEQVSATIMAADTFLGVVLGLSSAKYYADLGNGGYLGWLKTHKNGNPLDNMIASDNIIIRRFEVLGNWFSDLYSDHFPIYCDLELV